MLTADEIRAHAASDPTGGATVETGRDGPWTDDIPAGGALLFVRFAVRDASYTAWHPTIESARMSLAALAAHYGATVFEDSADLTAPGCLDSSAWIEVR